MESCAKSVSCCLILSLFLTCLQCALATRGEGGIDACNISHVNITSNPVVINTGNITDEFYGCDIELDLMGVNGTSIEILYSNEEGVYSNFYIEILASSNNCQQRYLSIDSKHCLFIVSDIPNFKLNYFNSQVTLKVQGITTNVTGCHDKHIQLVENGIVHNTCNATHYDEINKGRRPYGTVTYYEFTCPLECSCILGYKKWTTACNDDVMVTLLIYHTDTGRMSFAAQHMTDITADAFIGLSKLPRLDLNYNRLISLPAKVFSNMFSLERLYLSYNRLILLPAEVFSNMFSLIILNLHMNSLSSLPVGIFDNLAQMLSIHLSGNKLVTLDADVYDGLTKLDYIELANNQLATLPEAIFKGLNHLTRLYLHNNNFTYISNGMFGNLTNLKILNLNNNYLVSINNEFSGLSHLEDLRLEYNQLSKLHAGAFQGLYLLRQLMLTNNQLTSLPYGIFADLYSASAIRLENNKLFELPDGVFKSVVKLKNIALQNNLLSSIPDDAFSGLVNVNVFQIQHNQLTSLPTGAFRDMHLLVNMNLSYNSLTGLPLQIFESLMNVGSLSLNDNHLESLPENVFDNMTSLQYLNIGNNKLTDVLHDVFTSLDTLIFLNISNNNLHVMPSLRGLILLQILYAGTNKLKYMNMDTFQNMTTINFLSFDNNALSWLPVGIFDDLSNLEILYLENNTLTEIKPGLFKYLNNLVLLKLSSNLLSNITRGIFTGLTYLKNLDMQHNNIKALPIGAFDNLTHLKFVNLSYNSIQTIESKGFHTNGINVLDLRSNNLLLITKSSFSDLGTSLILVDESATCCFVENVTCISRNPRPIYLTCNRMLNDYPSRVSIWALGLFAIVCNVIVLYSRCVDTQEESVQSLLISHLALSDLLMGISMILMASADAYYVDYFPSHSESWRTGPICKLTSTLSVLSSEVSVILITLITIDRFQGVRYPFSVFRLRPKSAKICLTSIWISGMIISVVPIILSGFYSDIYEVSEVCVGLPIVRRPVSEQTIGSVVIESNTAKFSSFQYWNWKVGAIVYNYRMWVSPITISATYAVSEITGTQLATYFSIIVFIGLNLVCFVLVAVLYIDIFKTARDTTKKAGRNQTAKQEIRMSVKMSAIVLTDFFTWVPLIIVCILAQCQVISVDPLVYVWTVAFIIPINSAINPFLYTLITLIENRNTSVIQKNA